MKKYIKSSVSVKDTIENDLKTSIENYFDKFSDEDYKFEPMYRVKVDFKPNYYDDGSDALFIKVGIDGEAFDLVHGGEEFDLSEFGIDKVYITPNREDEFLAVLDGVIQQYDSEAYFEPYDYTSYSTALAI